MKGKKGQIGLMVVFAVVAIIIVFMAAFLAPMLATFNAKIYEEGEQLLLKEQDTINNIQNIEARTTLNNSVNNALDATAQNIEINNAVFQYGWVFVVFLTALIIFIYARTITIQTGGGAV